jgi:predicted RNase H-like nuclease (RuvC/YqgF family)
VEVFSYVMLAITLVVVLSQHLIYKKVSKINELLETQIKCDKKMLDESSKIVSSLNKQNEQLKNEVAELKKSNKALSDRVAKMTSQIEQFSNLFKGK